MVLMQKWHLVNFPEELIYEIEKSIVEPLEDAVITENSASGVAKRNSQISWIKDKNICRKVFGRISNQVAYIDHTYVNDIEPLQYGEYRPDGEYGWHRDVHPAPYSDGQIRKISFSVFLNNDYTGGEFDLEVYGPNEKKRYISVDKKRKSNCIIFHSDMWHRVRPVKSGVRKSLVGWLVGPQFR
tara:strand:- start:6859 stop:7410 length:552 start_codon:yes stop_codon:yes gene_type:complete